LIFTYCVICYRNERSTVRLHAYDSAKNVRVSSVRYFWKFALKKSSAVIKIANPRCRIAAPPAVYTQRHEPVTT